MKKCNYPDKGCPSMETQDNTCLLRNPFDCPMEHNDERLLKSEEIPYNPQNSALERHLYDVFLKGARAQLLKADKVCPECDGTGNIDAISNDGFGYTKDITARCPTCKGTGLPVKEVQINE